MPSTYKPIDTATVPYGDTIDVALDRMQRASNFASNGTYFAQTTDGDAIDTAELYIRSARMMLDEAQKTLDAIKASREAGAVEAVNAGARRVYCVKCERGHDGPCTGPLTDAPEAGN